MLSKKAIEEFRRIYFEIYGKKLSYAAAEEQAHRMIRFFKLILENQQTKDSKDEQSKH